MVAVDGAVCGVGTGVSMAFGVRAPHLCSSFTLFLLLLSFAKNETVSNFRSDPLFSENSQNNAIFRMVFWKEKKKTKLANCWNRSNSGDISSYSIPIFRKGVLRL